MDLNNNTTHIIFSPAEKEIIYICYVTVSVLGIVSNSLVCYLILRYEFLRTIVNLLILNLAISDIVAGIAVYPFVFLDIQSTIIRGKSANFLCGLSEGLTVFFVAAQVSLLTLSILSISRYLVINHPLRLSWKLKKNNVKWIIAFAWIISTALLLPSTLSFSYDEKQNDCKREWAPGVHPFTYFIATGILGFTIPLFSLTFTYFTTLYTLWFKKDVSMRRNSISSVKGNLRLKKRVIVLLGMLLLVYLVCWLPFAVYWLFSVGLGYYSKTIEDDIAAKRVAKVCIFIALCNTMLNPIIYAYSNRQLREAFLRSVQVKKVHSITRITTFNGTELVNYRRRNTISTLELVSPRLSQLSDNFRARDMTF